MFGQNFVHIKSTYSIDLINLNIKLTDYKQTKFRSTLLQNITSVEEKEGSDPTYFIEIPKSIFYKSISSEFEQYYVRALLQLSDFNNMGEEINDSWKYTTYYYFFFFSNVALHRYLQRGYIYLDASNTERLKEIFSTILKKPINIGKGNWFFKKKSESVSSVQIELTKVGGNVHQLIWQDLKSTIRTFESKSTRKNNSVENSILKNLHQTIRKNNSFSPSEIRNNLNYLSEISIDEIYNKIQCPKTKETDFIKNLTKYNYNNSNLSKINLSILIGQYVHLFNTAIISDIELRDSKSFKLKKKYHKQKNNE
ncbi:hypothetical protein [Tenacibaculum finnmarkense]|uniref:hypothetical protein n=1 Tax=Tenacibaculum finnmarkense TaxID=2781243 RepID=UPI001EFB11EA|nr:hypothetical protein [Tenacibaculum finnmarkense]MCG8796654.1 hypothetical protein [Tenacibaculum finnmarkense]MCG8798996.1 hypothetical protein [Tenacibaculum finnmarkense]